MAGPKVLRGGPEQGGKQSSITSGTHEFLLSLFPDLFPHQPPHQATETPDGSLHMPVLIR